MILLVALAFIVIYLLMCYHRRRLEHIGGTTGAVFTQLAARDPQDSYEIVGTEKYWRPYPYWHPYWYPYY